MDITGGRNESFAAALARDDAEMQRLRARSAGTPIFRGEVRAIRVGDSRRTRDPQAMTPDQIARQVAVDSWGHLTSTGQHWTVSRHVAESFAGEPKEHVNPEARVGRRDFSEMKNESEARMGRGERGHEKNEQAWNRSGRKLDEHQPVHVIWHGAIDDPEGQVETDPMRQDGNGAEREVTLRRNAVVRVTGASVLMPRPDEEGMHALGSKRWQHVDFDEPRVLAVNRSRPGQSPLNGADPAEVLGNVERLRNAGAQFRSDPVERYATEQRRWGRL